MEKFQQKQRYSVLQVYTDKCAGCRHVDPLLPHIEELLKGKYGSKNIAFAKIHLLNEAAFLQDIN